MTGCGNDPAGKVTEFKDTYHVYGIAFDPAAHVVAVSSVGSNKVHIWSLADKPKIIQELTQDPDVPTQPWALSLSQIDGLRFTSDGTILLNAHSGGEGNQYRIVRIWSTASWTHSADIVEKNAGGLPFPAEIAISNDNKAVMRVRSWGPAPDWGARRDQYGPSYQHLESFDTHTGQLDWTIDLPIPPSALALSPDGRLAAILGLAGYPGGPQGSRTLVAKLCFVDLEARSAQSCSDVLKHAQTLYVAAWRPDGRFVAISGDPGPDGRRPGVEIFDVATRQSVGSLTVDTPIVGLQYSANSRYLVVTLWDGVEIRDSEHLKLLQRIKSFDTPSVPTPRGGEMSITAAKMSVDGHWLAVASRSTVRVYTLQ